MKSNGKLPDVFKLKATYCIQKKLMIVMDIRKWRILLIIIKQKRLTTLKK